MAKAPRLTAPEPGEDLFMYLSVTDHVVSAVLLRDQGVQMLVYYISKTLVKDSIYLLECKLSLRGHAIWIEERRSHVSTDDDKDVPIKLEIGRAHV